MLRRRFDAGAKAFGAVLALAAASGPASGASISYGNFGPVPPGVSFEDVHESSGTDTVPLFGPPATFTTGLDFDPAGFVSSAVGLATDISDGQLNFTLRGSPTLGIGVINLSEAGDYSMAGSGTSATQVIAGLIIHAVVTQINGADVTPVSLLPSNASIALNLLANPGIVSPWSIGLALDIASQLDPGQTATAVEIVIDNQLLAFSETSSLSFISKKDFRIALDTVVIVPEPSTVLLMLFAFTVFPALSRRRL